MVMPCTGNFVKECIRGLKKENPSTFVCICTFFSNFGGEISFSFATENERLVKKRELKGLRFKKSSKLSLKVTYLTNLSISRKL